jgi:hypothetical protein
LQVNSDFGGSLTAADVGTGLVDFLAICEVSLEIRLLCLFTTRSHHPGLLISPRFCSLHNFVLPVQSP